jgi:hypothetical protein
MTTLSAGSILSFLVVIAARSIHELCELCLVGMVELMKV